MTTETETPGTEAALRRRRVAILMFDDVEVLDFAGPFEVFSVTPSPCGGAAFEVVTFALHPGEVVARNGLRVIPTLAAADLGSADILVVPGGLGTRRALADPEMLLFLRTASAAAEITLSVCTGSLMLAAAGLLDGLSATTHWGAIEALRSIGGGANILPEARIVDNGAIVTAAGVSAGIDASLYLVARLFGPDVAKATAHNMAYDWTCSEVDGRTVVRLAG